MKYTDTIYESCKSVKGNFRAQDIYELLLSKGIEIKKGTVNRVINRLYHRGMLGRTQHGVYFFKNGQISGQLDILKKMKFTDKEIEKLSAYLKRGMTVADAIKELEEEGESKFNNPVENAAADTLSKVTDIAIKKVDSPSGQPIFLVRAGGKQAQGDLNTVIQFLQDIMERNGQKEDKKEIDELRNDLAEIKKMIEKDEKERKSKIEQPEAKINNKIAQLQDAIIRELINRRKKAGYAKLFKELNDNGVLNLILRSAEQILTYRAKQSKLRKI